MIIIFILFLLSYRVAADSCLPNDASLQICNGSRTYFRPQTNDIIQIKPILTFFSLANIHHDEKTLQIFISLTLAWNDTRLTFTDERYVFDCKD